MIISTPLWFWSPFVMFIRFASGKNQGMLNWWWFVVYKLHQLGIGRELYRKKIND